MAGVRESIEGLRAEFRVLAGIGRTLIKVLRNVDDNVGLLQTRWMGVRQGTESQGRRTELGGKDRR